MGNTFIGKRVHCSPGRRSPVQGRSSRREVRRWGSAGVSFAFPGSQQVPSHAPFLGPFVPSVGCTNGPTSGQPASHNFVESRSLPPANSAALKVQWQQRYLIIILSFQPKTEVAEQTQRAIQSAWLPVIRMEKRNFLVTQPELVPTKTLVLRLSHCARTHGRCSGRVGEWWHCRSESWRPKSLNLPSLHCSSRLRSAKAGRLR